MNEQNNDIEKIPPQEENAEETSPEEVAETAELIFDDTAVLEETTPVPEEEAPIDRPIWSFAAQVAADREDARKRGMRGAFVYAIVMTCLFAVCFAILAVLLVWGDGNDKNKEENNVVNNTEKQFVSIADLVEAAGNSFLTVSVNTSHGTINTSGFICTKDGYIVTSSHAIEGADDIKVLSSDGREFVAEIVEIDEQSGVAILFAGELANDTSIDITAPEGISVIDGNKNLPLLVDSVINSVVTVKVSTSSGTGFGSGFVYTDQGHIITNYHVIDDAKKITVVCHDGRTHEAELIDGDELSDVAVILVKNLGIPSLAVGDSDALRVGEDVIAIGTPNDIEYAGTVTKGIISGVNRKVRIYENSGYLSKTMEMIQTDTTLNHGNSGGPLINMHGEVIGINTMKYYVSNAGDTLYFSIPINEATKIADDIIEDGEYSGNNGSATQGVQLGISCGTVYKGVPVRIDTNTSITPEANGVIVSAVNEGYAAYGKLELYDIIVSLDGVETLTVEQMRAELFKHKIGDTIKIEVWRDGQLIEVEITL